MRTKRKQAWVAPKAKGDVVAPAVLLVEDEAPEPASPVCYLSEFGNWKPDEIKPPMNIRIKRAYETAAADDGNRFLVDRLWPRGINKKALALTAWLKDIAPSDALRRWFAHDVLKWDEFCRRYETELKSHPEALRPLKEALKRGPVTLVYSARDEEHNQAVVLREFLRKSPTPCG